MCFKNGKHQVCKADEDIKCYKVMKFDGEKHLSSPIWRTAKKYRVGDEITASTKLSYIRSKNARLINRLDELNGEVVHSFVHLRDAVGERWGDNCAIVECTIPKGEYYWVNHFTREYASVSLKISKILYFEGDRVKSLLMWK